MTHSASPHPVQMLLRLVSDIVVLVCVWSAGGLQCVFVLDEFEESREITARRLLDNLQHVYNPDITMVSILYCTQYWRH